MKFALVNIFCFLKSTLLIGFILVSTFVSAQPEAPDLKYISIDPETDTIEVGYYASPSSSAIELEIKDVFQTAPTPKALPIQKISGNADGIIELDPSKFQSYSDGIFVVPLNIAIDASDGTLSSQSLAESHQAMVTTSDFEYCDTSVYLNWNKYSGFNITVEKTMVYRINSSGAATMLKMLSTNVQTDTIIVTEANKSDCYYIASELKDDRGNTHIVTSNKTCPEVKFPKLPSFMNADYATSKSDSSIELSFTIDTVTDIEHYKVWHSTSKNGPFSDIDSATLGKTPHPFIFEHSGTDVAKQRNFYMLVAYDECGDSILASNMASNIYLELEEDNLSNKLRWNAYYEWQGGIEDHYVYRSIDGGEYKQIGSENQNKEYLDYDDYLGELLYNNGEFCYYIEARELDNPHTKNGVSRSNIVCIVKEARIFIPNSFNPLSSIPANRVFMPQGSFFNIDEYHFTIWNRFDEIMFESDEYGKAWDGTYKGKDVPEGLYMFKVEVGHHNGKIEEKGTVSIKYKE